MLNNYLADLNIMNNKLRTLHYNIVGEGFVSNHRLIEEWYGDATEQIDYVAEMIRSFDKLPISSCKDFLERATLSELERREYNKKEALKIIESDLNHMIAMTKQIIKDTDCPIVENYFTEEFTKYQKRLWMVKAESK